MALSVLSSQKINNYQCSSELHGHTGEATSLTYNKSDSILASSCTDGLIHLWNMENVLAPSSLATYRLSSAITRLKRTEAGVVASTGEGFLEIVNFESGSSFKRKPKGNRSILNDVDVAGDELVTGSDDGTVTVLDIRSPTSCVSKSLNCPVTAVSNGLDCWYAGCADGSLYQIDRRRQGCEMRHNFKDIITSLSSRGDWLVSSSMDGAACLWDERPFAAGSRLLRSIHLTPSSSLTLRRANFHTDSDQCLMCSSQGVEIIGSMFASQIRVTFADEREAVSLGKDSIAVISVSKKEIKIFSS